MNQNSTVIMKRSIERVYHPYWLWEEVYTNMWGRVQDRQKYLADAIEFTGDHRKYGSYMIRVIDEWAYSCEHNLSNITQNRKAWLGHAACALAFDCPEDIVREAWGHLTKEQQDLANNEAENAITIWEERQCLKEG